MRGWIAFLVLAAGWTLAAGIVDCQADERDEVSRAGPSGMASGWEVVNVAADDPAGGVSLARTSSGAPRIAYINSDDMLKYALCDSECLDPAQWTVIELGEVDTSSSYIPLTLNLAIGPDDRAHILYGTAGSYTTCAGSCSDPGAWTVPVNVACDMDGPATALALTADGNPRTHSLGYAYARCNLNCDDPANWTCSSTGLGSIGWFPAGNSVAVQTPSPDVERPRILGQWYWPTGGGINSYVTSSCDEDCSDPSGWNHEQGYMNFWSGDYVTPLKIDSLGAPHFLVASYGYGVTSSTYGAFGMTFDGRSALSLALSAADAPRIAMLDATGALDFASCDSACDLFENWTFQDVTPEVSVVDLNLPLYVDIALDASGDPLLAYKYEGQLRFAVPAEPAPPWGAASTIQEDHGPASKVVNGLLLFILPALVAMGWKRFASGRVS